MITLYLQAEADVRKAQAEFDRQAEITKLLLEGISSTHVSVTWSLLVQKQLYMYVHIWHIQVYQ